MAKNKEGWGSRIGLILAMAGNAVGLGNFLRFPVKAVENGGGEFIIPYLVAFLLMGIPLLWIEWSMGRYGGIKGNHSTPFIMDSMGRKKWWKYIGVFGIFTNVGVIAYYTYIESWTLAYVVDSIQMTFHGMDTAQVGQHFDEYVDIRTDGGLVNTPWKAFAFFCVTLALNIWILSKGLSGGIEKVAKIAMPLLLIFGAFLAFQGLTLGKAGECDSCDSTAGLNFLWGVRDYSNVWNFKVWLEAAGQVFFTLSVGMGTIQAYSSYLKRKDDIALNAMSAGFMNSFVEVVLGASVVIPISVGYFGLDWLQENAGFMMAFKSMPYLFDQWDVALAVFAGVAWFGLLFFAGITSSLAMGTPWMGFMKDEFGWSAKKSAFSFGILTFILALPPIFFFQAGVFDEYDFWTGTVSLVIFATLEVILFAWIFGMKKGWDEITAGADIRVPKIYKYIMMYVTPVFLFLVLFGALFRPLGDDWAGAFQSLISGDGWNFDPGSIISMIFHLNVEDYRWFADGKPTNLFLIDLSRLLLVAVFVLVAVMVRKAGKRRELLNRD